jgi:hypothetical protein
MRLTPLPRQLRAYSFPSTPAFWMPIGHPCIRNFVHCMPLIARLPSASMHTFSHALRTLASLLLRPPRSHAHNTAAQCSIISLPLTLAGFVSPQSAPPLPSTFAFVVCTLDPHCLPVDCASYVYSIPAPHTAHRPLPDPTPPRARSAHPTRSLCMVCALDLHHPRTRFSPSMRSIPTIHTLHSRCLHTCSPHMFYAPPRGCPLFCTLLGPGCLCIFPAYYALSSAVFDVVFFYFSSYCTPLHLFRAVKKTTGRICTHVNASSRNENTLYYHCICSRMIVYYL